MTETSKKKRYNMTLPDELYEDLQVIADKKGTTVVELLRRFVRLGIMVAQLEDDPNAAFIIQRDGKEQRVMLI